MHAFRTRASAFRKQTTSVDLLERHRAVARTSAATDDKVCIAQELHARAEAVKEMEESLRARDDAETLAKARRLRALREEIDITQRKGCHNLLVAHDVDPDTYQEYIS